MLPRRKLHQQYALVATARLKRMLATLENASGQVRTNPLASWAKETLSRCLTSVGQYCDVAEADRENRKGVSRLYSCDIQFVIDELLLTRKDVAAIHAAELDESARMIAEVTEELQQALENGEFSEEASAEIFRFAR